MFISLQYCGGLFVFVVWLGDWLYLFCLLIMMAGICLMIFVVWLDLLFMICDF